MSVDALGLRQVLTVSDLQTTAGRRHKETFMKVIFVSAALLSIIISLSIIVSLAREAWTFLSSLISQGDASALWSRGWAPRRGLYDIKTLLVGSLLVTGIAMVIATPLGLGAAVYLSEYATPRVRRLLKPIIEVLAGVPSVVLGFFALSVVNPELVQRVFSGASPFNLLSAGIGVGILTVPLVASISEDALRAVPNSLREASAGVGAHKMATTVRVVIPAAASGLVAAMIIGVSRALGETMVVAVAAGASGSSAFTWNPLDQGQTMTAAMASLATGTDEVKTSAGGGAPLAFQSLFFVGAVLFVLTFALNLVAERFVGRVRQRY
ncbi:MAG: Phosphate transport system permease protein PstC [Acidimicrobiales bacterium]|nr:MAG: phosphate ABC transporter permease subunit PstC [Actinomycetota bacterium]MBV6509670.1 Phosphate transport system permease protein PstC [Acidimicrobiales bacterium]RIK06360.1 MAG: phosphate ABC transporter permease subunit PstC [Acidobacteriota bacterium]